MYSVRRGQCVFKVYAIIDTAASALCLGSDSGRRSRLPGGQLLEDIRQFSLKVFRWAEPRDLHLFEERRRKERGLARLA